MKNKIIYFNTENYSSIEKYKQNIDNDDININEYILADLQSFEFHLIKDTIKELINDQLIIIYGNIKLWTGISEIFRIDYTDNIFDLIIQNCDDFSIYFENDNLYIYGIHHDGYIQICLQVLTNIGLNIYNQWNNNLNYTNFNNQEIIKYIIDNHYVRNIPL